MLPQVLAALLLRQSQMLLQQRLVLLQRTLALQSLHEHALPQGR